MHPSTRSEPKSGSRTCGKYEIMVPMHMNAVSAFAAAS